MTLLSALQANGSWFPQDATIVELCRTLTTVGRWIRIFQAVEPATGEQSVEEIRDYVDVRLRRLVECRAAGFTPRDRDRVLAHVGELGAQLSERDRRNVAIHADMSIGNVLVSGRGVTVLDFAMATAGHRLHDLTRLYMQLDMLLLKPRFRAAMVARLQQSLIEGFDTSVNPASPAFRLMSLIHRINNLTTASVTPARLPASVYNRLVARRHRRWLEHELRREPALRRAS